MQHDEEPPAPAELVEFGGDQRPPSRWAAALDRLLGLLTTQRAIAVGAAVILGAVVLSTVVASRDDSDGDASAAAGLPATSPAPVRFSPGADEAGTAPRTTRVGYRGVMLAVPSAWVQSATAACTTAPAGWVAYPGSPPGDCPASAARDASTVTFHDDLGSVSALRHDTTDIGRVAGQPLSATQMEQIDGGYVQYLLAPGADVYVVIRSTCDDTTRRIVASARHIPDDRIRVPDLRGLAPMKAIRTIHALGLRTRVGHNSGEALPRHTEVVDQSPIRGVVLDEGAEVTIAVRPAR